MSIEQALIAKAHPYMLAEKARALIRQEVCKGCTPHLSARPTALEPAYEPLSAPRETFAGSDWDAAVPAASCPSNELMRLRIWLSPNQTCDWRRGELFVKQLSAIQHRVAFEIVGNCEEVAFQLLLARRDLPTIRAAFDGQFELCETTEVEDDPFGRFGKRSWAQVQFRDVFPPPPYSHLLTRPDELHRSPFATVIAALTMIPDHALGFYQVLFAPAPPDHNWHQNVRALLDMEFSIKLAVGVPSASRYPQQEPSGDLKQMATAVEQKAHSDKPFFFAALRLGVIDGEAEADTLMQSLAVGTGLLQHGGRPLDYLTEQDYVEHLPAAATRELFTQGLSYRPGFLVNSWELTSLVHLPTQDVVEPRKDAVVVLEALPPDESLSQGTPIGRCFYAGVWQPVCVPEDMRAKHVHLIGKPGMGKSTMIEHMVLHDVAQGDGVAVIDPHGQMVQRLLRLLPPSCADRVIYIDFSDQDWVPIWNPLRPGPNMHIGRVTEELVGAFKSFVLGWGDRLEHMLRHAIFGLMHQPQACLRDVANLLRCDSSESGRLRPLVVAALDDPLAKDFWREDFGKYRSTDISPAQHKLGKLVLTAGSVSQMFSQCESAFHLQDVMEKGHVLLLNLFGLGTEVQEVLGCFLMSMLHLTAVGRKQETEGKLKPFHIYCDEAHKFLTDAMENMIAETRKFNVSLTLAHQYLAQFNARKAGALSTVGSTIIFGVDTRDSQYLKKDLQGLVEVEDIITLDIGQALARISNRVVKLSTLEPIDIRPDNACDLFVAQSRDRYHKPADQVRQGLLDREDRRSCRPKAEAALSALMEADRDGSGLDHAVRQAVFQADFAYDEF